MTANSAPFLIGDKITIHECIYSSKRGYVGSEYLKLSCSGTGVHAYAYDLLMTDFPPQIFFP